MGIKVRVPNLKRKPPRMWNNPQTLLQNVDREIKANVRQHRPAWYDAVRMIPPAVHNLRSAIDVEVGAFQRSDAKSKEGMYTFPRKIEYPEDELRKAFYQWHPFELDRPVMIKETEGTLRERDFSNGLAGPQKDWTVTGDTVVHYTMYLMSPAGGSLSRPVAYRKALNEFYQQRAHEESRERIAREALRLAEEQAEAAVKLAEKTASELEGLELASDEDAAQQWEGAEVPLRGPLADAKTKPWTAKFAEREMEEIQKSQEYQSKIDEEYVNN
ncbi:mitochondrial ribosomal small subunit component [Rhizophlyctis rosea]|nr:mitochondrial ribosomal small subunit component [Rhizophlyctis rosea]